MLVKEVGKRLFVLWATFTTSLVISSPAFATEKMDYFQIKQAIARGDDINLFPRFSQHPLYPDLAARFYKKNLERDGEIIQIFSMHYTAHPVKELHDLWVEKKYNDGDYASVVQHYFNTGSTKTECIYRASQLALGNLDAALDNIYPLWMSKQPIASQCDAVFLRWDGRNNPEFRIKRAKMAYHSGRADFTLQLAARLPLEMPEREILVDFANFLKSPESMLNASVDYLTNSALAQELLPTALNRLIRIDSSQYAAFATQFSTVLKDNVRYQKVLAQLTEYLANRQDPQAIDSYSLLINPSKKATNSIVRYLVNVQDWQKIQDLIPPNTNNTMALYWLGRSLELAGKDGNKFYQKAARERSYYGFLAADKLQQPYAFNSSLILRNLTAQQQLDQNSTIKRIKQLAQHGELIEARREIIRLARQMSLARHRQFAYWLHANAFHFEAIYILGQMRDWNDISIRFPIPYNTEVTNASQLVGTHPTWIYAIVRQESSMNPKAVSRANAKGLMQLIPSTAQRMASQEEVLLDNNAIFEPEINIRLGAAYLAKMFYRYDNLAMASAAYNAGPGRVDKWLENNILDMTIWVENIPFKETRKYVKNILEYQQVYAYHLGIKIPTLTDNLEGRFRAVK